MRSRNLFVCAVAMLGVMLRSEWLAFSGRVWMRDLLIRAAEAAAPPAVRVHEIVAGQARAMTLFHLLNLGIFDELAEKGPTACRELGRGTFSEVGASFACRYARFGAGAGLLERLANGSVALTEAGKLLVSNHPTSMRDYVMIKFDQRYYESERRVGEPSNLAAREPKSGFKLATGLEFFDYMKTAPDFADLFDAGMQGFSAAVDRVIVADYEVSPSATVCDVGGGTGHLLASFLQEYPKARGILFDQDEQVKAALQKGPLRPFAERTQFVATNFFETLSPVTATCDVIFMKWIVHDWGDEDAVQILRNVAAAALPGATLVLFEMTLDVDGPSFERLKHVTDFYMLNLPVGARERTLADPPRHCFAIDSQYSE
ncbi:hypothetical protein CTAYLR_000997 [Chrysophaeum taylorii]|uniref:O-methyltransferase C-terminal domain-containing protein n=1 Tax=Chrysophaeum taylorii TaxID=2483200 RepID=A0AAD7XQ64_9STRA|nr:hypothetical protein CTAYLR_000997 [Chrysophaeum taylorii]